ncbi:NAD(P)-dependent oxidoreductase [Planobispora rosea]|uniref:dTDP-4-dehydrorhamnose reductase n=1 Tax=Planobispora rosea TaxID=35762 RepID=A0A8J3WCL5_PLARO|nr:dTDP-4-dehydrorhamnose reductase [Planobispora rosea]GGS83065.1 NAD(P)-dependent oxidoreductase [Planobispora rosea]GIH84168.1 NAD(P)-dependent oxidoreductase [Planobispora rosea]
MRWLVTGARGLLGTDLVALLRARGGDVVAVGREELDVRDIEAVRAVLKGAEPDVVVNCAGWTAVDDAETNEDRALAVNGDGPRSIAAACSGTGIRLLHLSTDYVFSGRNSEPYAEDAPPAPLNAYGRTKLAGERAVLTLLPDTGYVVRTAWLYGAAGPSFVRTMIRLEAERETVEVVDDQHGQPTWTMDLARQLVALGRAAAPAGVYHATSSGQTTWYGLAREVFTLLGADPGRVRPVPTSAFPRPAVRPVRGVLAHGRWAGAGLSPIRDWREALRAAWPSLSG